jgi:hypothetical protein
MESAADEVVAFATAGHTRGFQCAFVGTVAKRYEFSADTVAGIKPLKSHTFGFEVEYGSGLSDIISVHDTQMPVSFKVFKVDRICMQK